MLKDILTLIGVPTVAAGALIYLGRRLAKALKRMKAVELGLQALLRAQLIADYNYYAERGSTPLYARENFENCWLRYEELGANGVLRDIRDRFMALPDGK